MDNNRIENRLVWPVLTIGTPFGGRLHRELTAETHQKHNLERESGGYRIRLYKKVDSDPITQLEGRIRRWFERRSAPWNGASTVSVDENRGDALPRDTTGTRDTSQTGMRVMPAAIVVEVERERAALQEVWKALTDAKVAEFDKVIERAKDLHKGSFNPRWYPANKDAFAREFVFGWDILELPGRGHWMLDLPNAMLEEMQAKGEARTTACLKGMKRNLVTRLLKPVTEWATVLKGEKDFQATRWDRLERLAEEVEKLNVDNDPALVEVLGDLRRILAVDPVACRDYAPVREELGKKAQEIADRMATLFG